MAPTIVTRAKWGARAPKGSISTTTWSQRVGVAIHHSAGPTTQTVRQIQDYQMDHNGWVDIGYNWLVTQDGRLWEGRQGTWLAIGAHAANQNTAWVGVCWIGTSGTTAPTPAALATLAWVWEEAQRRAGRQLLVSGHGQLPGQATECPGSRLRTWIAAGLPTEGDDMATAKEVWDYNIPRAADIDEYSDDPSWRALSILRSTQTWAYRATKEAREAQAQNAAILAAVTGQDVVAAVAAELAKAATRERTERAAEQAELLATLPAAVAAAVPGATVETVEAALREVLGGLDEQG
jgi:hypothetical protein